MFYKPSPRYVTPEIAADIIRSVPQLGGKAGGNVSKVGVFVDALEDEIRSAVEVCGLDAVQLHGEESPEFCRALMGGGLTVIKAFRIRDEGSLDALVAYETSMWLLDSYVPGQLGGTGARFNWDLAIEAKAKAGGSGRAVILAGGLTPENVAEAVAKVGPDGLDVSSGVESAPGLKDAVKIGRFIEAVRG